MTWPEFLNALKSHSLVTLVGPMAKAAVTPDSPTVFVDGGLRFRAGPAPSDLPQVSVGDGDSGELPLDLHLNPDKDFSDLAFVLRELPARVSHLRLIGFLGGRRDHELANLGEVHRFLKARSGGARAEFFGSDKIEVIGLRGDLALEVHGVFSVLTFEPARVRISGACRYSLDGSAMIAPVASHGISNLGSGQIRLGADDPCFIFLNAGA